MPMNRRPGERAGEDNEGGGSCCALPSSILALSLLLACLLVAAWAPPDRLPAGEIPDLSGYPWLYLRDGEPLAAGEPVVELIVVGDVMLGRGVGAEPSPFAAIAPWLRSADLTLGNLECVIAAGGARRPGPYRFRAPLRSAAALEEAGFDILWLANNHALDFGPEALAESVTRLQEAGLASIGASPDGDPSPQMLIRDAGGVRLAFLAVNAIPDPQGEGEGLSWRPAGWDAATVIAAVAAARSQADAVVVSVHWGYEYDIRVDPSQRAMAQVLLDAGADLVVGHHPHVVQGCALGTRGSGETGESPAHAFVAYSLGNLVFDQEGTETLQGLALRAFFDRQGLRAVQALPVQAGPRPRLMGVEEAAAVLARVEPGALGPSLRTLGAAPEIVDAGESTPAGGAARVGWACDAQACRAAVAPTIVAGGVFHDGEIDLTGDGQPERVRLANGQIVVSHAGEDEDLWTGLSEWWVVDLALGDADDDGRADLFLALWKRDDEGQLGSHPTIVGYRGGTYRVIWGGSPAPHPIREVELGDVDGDGVQELVVLEVHGQETAVAVWRWHGWGFSLVWRSPTGRLRDLLLVPREDGSRPLITAVAEP
jgi:hypothetical protein